MRVSWPEECDDTHDYGAHSSQYVLNKAQVRQYEKFLRRRDVGFRCNGQLQFGFFAAFFYPWLRLAESRIAFRCAKQAL